MAEKCTNTSSPPSCSMKPYPLASLNHFTFPLITIRLLQSHTHRAPIWVACPAVVPGAIEMTGDLRPVKTSRRSVQRAIQLAIAQHAANVAARFRIRNQLDKTIGIARPFALEPASHRRRTRIVCGDCGVGATEASQQFGEMRRSEM